MSEAEKYIMVPNKFVIRHRKDGFENEFVPSLTKKYECRELIFIHTILAELCNKRDEINTTLDIIRRKADMPDRKENYSTIRNVLGILQFEGYISKTINFNAVKNKIHIKFNYQPIDIVEDNYQKYFTISYSMLDKLKSVAKGRNVYNYVNVFSYISSRTYKASKDEYFDRDGRYETCNPSQIVIADELCVTDKTVAKILIELKELGLIYYENAGRYFIGTKIKNTSNTYTVCDRKNYKEQVKMSIKYYKEREVVNNGIKWL